MHRSLDLQVLVGSTVHASPRQHIPCTLRHILLLSMKISLELRVRLGSPIDTHEGHYRIIDNHIKHLRYVGAYS